MVIEPWLEVAVKAIIMPGFSELVVVINPTKEVTREGVLLIMPWFYAPWPGSQERGIIEMTVPGDSLRALLTELSKRYREANVDLEIINPETNDLDFDYDVWINDQNYTTLGGLDIKLKADDTVNIKVLWRWDG
jgi:molybdopterin converting factor small subunit